MLPKRNRLKKKKDFEAVFKKGKSFKTGFLLLRTAKNGLEFSRFGFIISTKFSKKAVVRNRVRRVISNAIETRLKGILPGFDCVVAVRPGFEEKNLAETEKLLKKSGILKWE